MRRWLPWCWAAAAAVAVVDRSRLGLVALAAVAAAPLGLCLVLMLPTFGWAVLLVAAALLSGARFAAAGFHFLPEHLVLVGFCAALLVRSPRSLLRRPAAYEALLLAWIAWNLLTSLLFALDPHESLAIVGWMLLAWAILWSTRGWFLAHPGTAARTMRVGSRMAAVLGAATFVLWAAALVGLPEVRVQPEFVTGSLAAKGPALEANLLGSQSLCWLFLALRGRALRRATLSPWVVAGLALGIVSTMTRAVWMAAAVVAAGAFLVDLQARRRRATASTRPGRPAVPRLVALGMVMVLVTVGGGVAGQKLQAAFDFSSATGGTRLASWRLALEDLSDADAHLVGLGTNSYGQRHLSRTQPGRPDYLSNLPLTLLYDGGLVAVTLFVAAMALVVLRGRSAPARLLNLTFMVALLLAGAATNPIWFGFVWITLALLDSDRGRPGPGGRGRATGPSLPLRVGAAA